MNNKEQSIIMPNVDRITTLQYLGSKSRLLENICIPIIENEHIDQVVDLFAGTGSVGYALSSYKTIISNDLEYYSFVLNEAILNGCSMNNSETNNLFKNIERNYHKMINYLNDEIALEQKYLSSPLETFDEYASFSKNTPSVFNKPDISSASEYKNLIKLVNLVIPGKEKQNVPFPCLFVTYFSNAYFGINQCCQIDAIASTIMNLKDERKDDFIKVVRKFMEMDSLTAPMLRELIDHIDVYEKEGGKKNYTQRIVIYYRFVGFIEIPKKAEDENYKADTRVGVEVEYVPAKSA